MMAGFRRFRNKYFEDVNNQNSIYSRLASIGQSPQTLLIGCSDSRVDPAILTEAAPGEIFVVRNVANLVPPCETSAVGFHGTSSAIEFAVKNLKVSNIIVLGHRQCGGIQALMNSQENTNSGFIDQWMSIANEAKKKVLLDHPHEDNQTLCQLAEKESIKVSIKNLKTFPFVLDAIEKKELQLIGIYFDLEQGQLWEYIEDSQSFRLLEI